MDNDRVVLFLATLTVIGQVAIAATVLLALTSIFGGAKRLRAKVRDTVAPAALPLALLVACVAMGGSLFLSEVMHFPPCDFCWYQRIAMYPLVALLLVALIRRDTAIGRAVWPLPIIGSALSIYHYQLQRFPSQESLSCDLQTPCTATWVWEYHYISTPMMALTAFVLIGGLLWFANRGRADIVQ